MYECTNNQAGSGAGLILERFRLRWAVLTAWCDQLDVRKAKVAADTRNWLDKARAEVASSQTSSDVAQLLAAVEGALVLAEGPRADGQISYWIDLLLATMQQRPDSERLLGDPTIRAIYGRLGAQS